MEGQTQNNSLSIPTIDLITFLLGSPDVMGSDGTDEPGWFDPEAPLFVSLDSQKSCSFIHLKQLVKCFASGLQKIGLKPGHRILAFVPNSLYVPVIYLGTIAAGGIFVGLIPESASDVRLKRALSMVEPNYIFTSEEFVEDVARALKELQSVTKLFLVDDFEQSETSIIPSKPEVWTHWSKLLDLESGHCFAWKSVTTRSGMEATIVMTFTSGTTGTMKAVEMTHRSWVASVVQLWTSQRSTRPKQQKWLSEVKMTNSMGQQRMILPLKARDVVYVTKGPIVDQLPRLVALEITNIQGTKKTLNTIIERGSKEEFATVLEIWVGGSYIPPRALIEASSLLGEGRCVVVDYGCTEQLQMFRTRGEKHLSTPFCIGTPSLNVLAKVVDKDGIALSSNEQGEIWVKSCNSFKGYFGNPYSTANFKGDDGWFRTGDLGYYDYSGAWYMVGRQTEQFWRNKVHIVPRLIENLLYQHPSVQESCVIPIVHTPGAIDDHWPRAYVVLWPGKRCSIETLKALVESKVSKDYYLDGGVVFVDGLPRHAGGKVDRLSMMKRGQEEFDDGKARSARLWRSIF